MSALNLYSEEHDIVNLSLNILLLFVHTSDQVWFGKLFQRWNRQSRRERMRCPSTSGRHYNLDVSTHGILGPHLMFAAEAVGRVFHGPYEVGSQLAVRR